MHLLNPPPSTGTMDTSSNPLARSRELLVNTCIHYIATVAQSYPSGSRNYLSTFEEHSGLLAFHRFAPLRRLSHGDFPQAVPTSRFLILPQKLVLGEILLREILLCNTHLRHLRLQSTRLQGYLPSRAPRLE